MTPSHSVMKEKPRKSPSRPPKSATREVLQQVKLYLLSLFTRMKHLFKNMKTTQLKYKLFIIYFFLLLFFFFMELYSFPHLDFWVVTKDRVAPHAPLL